MHLTLGLLDENTFWVSRRPLGRPRSSSRRLAGASARASASDYYSEWLDGRLVGRSTPSAAEHQDHPAPVENVSPSVDPTWPPSSRCGQRGLAARWLPSMGLCLCVANVFVFQMTCLKVDSPSLPLVLPLASEASVHFELKGLREVS
ncbi:hypothetical protein CFIO01_06920 [Colletotrichum fioriniae PJ7]|uniref:Uncharacterized protein n=1 Tax=Colletotrichum fioriniae PJ7 TaxID=1445577 RepID=A0A010Q0H4_9PEZI|nr:hypothetical protein CFIO01_06920 [Colletotrichum fioriniae PJ7]